VEIYFFLFLKKNKLYQRRRKMPSHHKSCKSEACISKRDVLIKRSAAVIAVLSLLICFQFEPKLRFIVVLLGGLGVMQVRNTINTAHFSETDA